MVELPENLDLEDINERIDKSNNIPDKLRTVHRNILQCFYWYGDELQRVGYTLEYVQNNIKWPILYSQLLICTDPWEYVIKKINNDKNKLNQYTKYISSVKT
jgi:hypothetical protein